MTSFSFSPIFFSPHIAHAGLQSCETPESAPRLYRFSTHPLLPRPWCPCRSSQCRPGRGMRRTRREAAKPLRHQALGLPDRREAPPRDRAGLTPGYRRMTEEHKPVEKLRARPLTAYYLGRPLCSLICCLAHRAVRTFGSVWCYTLGRQGQRWIMPRSRPPPRSPAIAARVWRPTTASSDARLCSRVLFPECAHTSSSSEALVPFRWLEVDGHDHRYAPSRM